MRSWAIQIGSGVTFTPSKNLTSSPVQLTHPGPTHTPCRVPHPRPTCACICPHTDPSKCPGTFPLSARPYVQCTHMPCRVSHLRPTRVMRPISAHWPVRATARVGSDTICNTLPTKAAPPNPSVGVSTRTHSTLLTLLSSLRVKGLTRGCYGWWIKTYKLAPPLLN
jgi:hypothetical protein